MGWSGPPNQISRGVVANYSVPSSNYNPADMSPYYNTFQPQPSVPVFEYGGHGMNGYSQMVCPESSGFPYPCISQPDMAPSYLQSQQPAYTHYADYHQNPAVSNSSRQQRNAAEKNRRDKLNSFISEIATLVPMVHNSSKRMDKTSVLRLAATFLRQYQLTSTTRQNVPKLPQSFRSINWFDLVLEEMNGVMITVTSAGKIVFITDNIEKILGHTQSELFGQSLFKITCPEDHMELKKCLAPDDAEECSAETDLPDCSSDDLSGSESNSCSRSCTSRFNSDNKGSKSASQQSGRGNSTGASSTVEKQRRSCYLRLRTRSLARTEQPQYELVQLVGYLEVPKKLTSQTQRRNRKNKVDVPNTNSNEIILVAILKPFKERRVTETSLMEATRDEYITRHLLDGRIIYSDHRISVISGYLFEEVSGLHAFNFMHKEDVRWVLIALRQMLWRGESFGKSCYRLKSKTGEFIYLQTHGYLELNANSESYASYICVNTLLSNAEGEREIRMMRRRFSALIESKIEPGIVAIAKDLHDVDEVDLTTAAETEDPGDLKDAIRAMISNIPAPATSASEDPENSQFAKAKLMSKALPPVSQTGCANIVTMVEDKSPATAVMSPQTPTMGSSVGNGSQPSTPNARTPNSPSVSSSCAMQVRPSVLRLASNQPITIYDSPANNLSNDCDTETTLSSRQQMNNLHCAQAHSMAADQVSERSMYNNHVGVVRRLGESVADDKRVGVVIIQKGANKRHFDFEEDCSKISSVPNKRMVMGGVPPPIANHSYDPKCSQTIKESLSPLQESPLHANVDFPEDLESCIGACDPSFAFEIDSFEQKPNPVQMLDLLRGSTENLKRNHIKLESQMQLQGAQINTLEGEIADVSYTDRFCLENNLGKLRVRLLGFHAGRP